jgi:hypothetical protein
MSLFLLALACASNNSCAALILASLAANSILALAISNSLLL